MTSNLPNRICRSRPHRPKSSGVRIIAVLLTLASLTDGTIDAFAGVRYVDANSLNPTPPYTTWATAARVIQDAVDAADAGDEVVVTNGTYSTGGRPVSGTVTNRVAITIPLNLRSVNGPLCTTIEGYQVPGRVYGDTAVRCVYLASGAALSGFTLKNGGTKMQGDLALEQSGGGLWCEDHSASVSNCIITANAAYWWGGGAFGGRLNNCLLFGNSVTNTGGGGCSNFLHNCTVVSNRAHLAAAGVAYGFVWNSIVWENRGPSLSMPPANYDSSSVFQYSCTSPLPAGSAATFDGDPQFLDPAAANYRLTSSSPCINSGFDGYAPTGPDLDSNPRVFEGTVDMGAYEFQGTPVHTAPHITIAPTNQSVGVGAQVLLVVGAGGTPPLRYQWRYYDIGTPVPGGATNVLVFTNVQPADANGYFAVVTNLYGAATSSVAFLKVTNGPPPVVETHYVDFGSANPVPPYTNWATAARVIQDAVDVASAGDEIVVASGVYAEGGRAVHGLMTNRVAVDKPLRIRSLNGPGPTIIEGRQVPGTTNGDGAIRCVYLANGSSLTGFTLRNGATRAGGDLLTEQSGGGVWCGDTGAMSAAVSIKNCILSGNSAANLGGGAYGGTVGDTVLIGNTAANGGGAAWATLTNCTVAGNRAVDGGGALQSRVENCELLSNTASWNGGAVSGGTVFLCRLERNSAWNGGGASYAALTNCILKGNWASEAMYTNCGGGADRSTLSGCLVLSNSAPRGAGASQGTLIGCTVAANQASWRGGGTAGSVLMNSIVYFNTAPEGSNYYSDDLSAYYSCTTPLPPSGVGNISSDPLFRDLAHGNLRLQPNSPCVNAGLNSYVGWFYDLDWNYRFFQGPVDMGAYESTNIVVTPPYITQQPVSQSVTVGGEVTFTVTAGGTPVLGYQWRHEGREIDGATQASLSLYAVQLKDAGNYSVIIFNSAAQITSDDAVLTVNPPVAHYVDLNSPNPTPPYTSWETAAHVLQDAVDVAMPGDEVVVTDGVYATGGRAVHGTMTNRVAVTKALTLRSVNGPQYTVLEGYQVPGTTNGDAAIRCAYLTNGAVLSGFTLQGGATQTNQNTVHATTAGGGAYCDSTAVISNCVLTGNAAYYFGGGVHRGILYTCTISGNSAPSGGGAHESTLNTCLVLTNAGSMGGGVCGGTANNSTIVGNTGTGAFGYYWGKSGQRCTLNNCIVYYNAPEDINSWSGVYSGSNCCVAQLLEGSHWFSPGTITNAPLFADIAGGDLRLRPGSPCINAGYNAYAPPGVDFAGTPRIVGGTVDIGAYEFQGADPTPFYDWLARYGLPADGSADESDSDNDGLANWDEWQAGTNPTNAASVLRLLSPVIANSTIQVTWESVAGIGYFLERRTAAAWATNHFAPILTNFPGCAGTTMFLDTNAGTDAGVLYRVGVRSQ